MRVFEEKQHAQPVMIITMKTAKNNIKTIQQDLVACRTGITPSKGVCGKYLFRAMYLFTLLTC